MGAGVRRALACLLAVFATLAAQAQPARLSDTGLFASARAQAGVPAGGAERAAPPQPAADLIAFTPQYPLWSDGATKRRWLRLPPGAAIDARDVDAWRFPRGTQLWKEFAVDGRPVETRYIEHRRDGRWIFATYAWNADGTDADLVPAAGDAAWPVAGAPGGRYALPSVADCHACHESAAVPVLGFAALQLSPARAEAEPGAGTAAGIDLRQLVETRRLRGLPPRLLATPPRIAADSLTERAALGYLHANCGHCHNRSGNQVPLKLTLAQRVADLQASRAEVLASTLNATSRFRTPGASGAHDAIVTPGDPARSLLVQRMASREPRLQMPPLGTQVPDADGLALVRRWIAQDPLVAMHPVSRPPPPPVDHERRARP
ncbi:MAG: hypothetical protein KIT17_13825 [Rubrivivax sp.]|nr:hypothetical protein [Rubrivivax sp.]